ncbi:hypothetical protein RchiOBHm_Chr4g0426911 [Rosa chinensis]|uniref:Uncharacterized protein n=1 Tax=Rosa chinensis TaxID=74649 RepID=A0A2P6QZN4_ROSCH|nr:hypothetical protein RchiOBHm_Chr4g0426911 [Rosa chinensis]
MTTVEEIQVGRLLGLAPYGHMDDDDSGRDPSRSVARPGSVRPHRRRQRWKRSRQVCCLVWLRTATSTTTTAEEIQAGRLLGLVPYGHIDDDGGGDQVADGGGSADASGGDGCKLHVAVAGWDLVPCFGCPK